jgi:colicin import membrane protein
MAKKLKVYQTSIGFFDLAVAAPSMKAAAEAWGSDPDIFKRGFAKQTEDPKVVEATTAAPGVVLRRPVGSDGEFAEKAALPKAPEGRRPAPKDRVERADASRKPDTKSDEKAKHDAAATLEKEKRDAAAALEKQKREAAVALEKEQKRLALDRAKAEAERERAKKQREQMIAKADAAFERARSRHQDAMNAIRQRREELDRDEAREDERWQREQQAHDDALKEAGA